VLVLVLVLVLLLLLFLLIEGREKEQGRRGRFILVNSDLTIAVVSTIVVLSSIKRLLLSLFLNKLQYEVVY